MSEPSKPPTPHEIRRLIERIDGQLREAERLRVYANERPRRAEFYPERRKTPRFTSTANEDSSSGDSA